MTQLQNFKPVKCSLTGIAAKITEVIHKKNPDETGKTFAQSYGADIYTDEQSVIEVGPEFILTYQPEAGGYLVIFDGEDGIPTYYPDDAFHKCFEAHEAESGVVY